MKKLFKNKKQLAIISGAAALLLVIAVVYLLTPQNKLPVSNPTSEPSASDTEQSIQIETPDSTDESDTTDGSTASEITDDGSALKPDESVSDSTDSQTTGEKAKETVSTVQEADPPKNEDESDNGGGIQIGGGETETKYSCGSPNHHCDGPETHAYILNLELQGCPYCGSHSCPSFYAVDKWGNACYTPSKCPKYDITKDPVYYCQVCGRKNGNGDNNTCQKWIVDTVCPICGKLVKANECHTH